MLDPVIKEMATTGKNFATISFHLPNGQIATHVMWVDADDEHMLINTERHRAKFKAVEQDPRVNVMVWNVERPYEYVEVRGQVVGTVGGQEARDHIDSLAQKYQGTEYKGQIESERVILKIRPDRQRVRGH
jgi:PPOX class probable F420-dependent enzyme